MMRLIIACSAAVGLLAACSGTPPSLVRGPTTGMDGPVIKASPDWFGTWHLDHGRSTAVDPWLDLSVVFAQDGGALVLKRQWRGTREGGTFTDSVRVRPDGPPATAKLAQWPDNRHLGAYISGDSLKTTAARWADGGRTLITESTLAVSVQQGERALRIYTEYRLAPAGDRLDVLELRSSRPRPIHYVFTRTAP